LPKEAFSFGILIFFSFSIDVIKTLLKLMIITLIRPSQQQQKIKKIKKIIIL
jgi:hypothetical protein